MFLAIRQRLCMAYLQKWANDILLTWQHTYQTLQAAAAQPVKQQCLDLVTGMVSHSNRLPLGDLSQKAIAGRAGRVLQ